MSGEQAIFAREPSLVPDIANGAIQTVICNTNATADAAMQLAANPLAGIGATPATATENVTKVANVLQSVNPLHFNIIPKGTQDSQVRCPSVASIVTSLTHPGCCAPTAEFTRKSTKFTRIKISRFLRFHRPPTIAWVRTATGRWGTVAIDFGSSKRLLVHARF